MVNAPAMGRFRFKGSCMDSNRRGFERPENSTVCWVVGLRQNVLMDSCTPCLNVANSTVCRSRRKQAGFSLPLGHIPLVDKRYENIPAVCFQILNPAHRASSAILKNKWLPLREGREKARKNGSECAMGRISNRYNVAHRANSSTYVPKMYVIARRAG